MGVISKTELATEEQIACARELLTLAGADPILTVSAFTGQGIETLTELLREEKETPILETQVEQETHTEKK